MGHDKMDRAIVTPGALPQDIDVLNTNLFAMVGQAFLNASVIGTAAAVSGLAIAPTAPASLQVTVGVGSIYELDPTDASAYGSLGINTTQIVKQGIASAVSTLTVTPPATSGFSQIYLVQVALQDADTGATVLSFYNSANPTQPFSGPNNSGTSSFTIRQCKCAVSLKAGVPATTGTETAPAPDSGFIGLYTITVPNGASNITSSNISQLASAPFFPTLPQVPYQVQEGLYTYAGQDSGTANAYAITFDAGQPIPQAYTAGMKVSFKALNACTGASTVNVNGLGNVAIRRASGTALSANDIVSGGVVELTYDGTVFQMVNYLGSGATSNTTTAVDLPYVVDSGAQNALIATFSPAITSGEQIAGFACLVKLAHDVTGACTINVNGLGAKAVKTGDQANPPNGMFVAGEVLLLIYDGTLYQIANTNSQTYRKPAANTTIYVNASLGSDTLYDGTSATVAGGSSTAGPFATIGRAMTAAYGYAPSQFTITISVANGTYNENVVTPSTAGPNALVQGQSTAGVIVVAPSAQFDAFEVQGPNTLTVQNVTVQNGGFGANGSGTLITNNTASNSVSSIFVADNGAHVIPGAHTINSSFAQLFFANAGGVIELPGSEIFTFATTVAASDCVAKAESGGIINCPILSPIQFVNPQFVSGKRYSADLNGIIFGASVSNFPGTVAGTTASGGQIS